MLHKQLHLLQPEGRCEIQIKQITILLYRAYLRHVIMIIVILNQSSNKPLYITNEWCCVFIDWNKCFGIYFDMVISNTSRDMMFV